MRATVYHGPFSLEAVERPDPVTAAPTDAVVRVSLGYPPSDPRQRPRR
ncbi:MAG TPA: hypothetical protein VGI83_01740 [Gemmatimonadales bacterium]|jgi:hypothetical protein